MDGILEEKWSGVSSHWKYDVIPYSRLVRNGGECREIFGVSMKQAIHVPGIYIYVYIPSSSSSLYYVEPGVQLRDVLATGSLVPDT